MCQTVSDFFAKCALTRSAYRALRGIVMNLLGGPRMDVLICSSSAFSRSGSYLPAASVQVLSGHHDSVIRKTREASFCPRASKDNPTPGFKYPTMTRKPRWWWRSLACLPYLMPLHETWMYAETSYNIHPFLQDFKYLCSPFLQAIGKLPGWFLVAYFSVGYLGVVKRKEWPHFFRFHVVNGMLLEISLQVTGMLTHNLPAAVYWGKLGAHFWLCFGFGFLFTVLKCIACALQGTYADVPFISDAAYTQIPVE